MIIFNGQDMVMHKIDGKSDFTLITFMGVNFHHMAEELFFLGKIAKKFNFNCYGVAAKKPNWYVSEEIEECVKIIDADTQIKKRILIGPSMGGFAAIKYSKKFKADIVFSLAPQYTIDPNEEVERNNYKQFFLPNMNNMSIKEEDVYGQIFIAVDPLDKGDVYHAEKILSSCINSKVKIVPVFYAEHIVYNSISGSFSIKSILEALSTGNFEVLFKVLTRQRKKNINNIKLRLSRASNRHSGIVGKTIISRSIERKNFLYQDSHFVLNIAYKNYLLKNYDIVNNIKNELIFYSKFDADFDMNFSKVYDKEKMLVDCRGNILILSKNMKEIRFVSYHDNKRYDAVLSIFLYGSDLYLSLNYFNIIYFISFENNSIKLRSSVSVNTLKYDQNNHVILTNSGFLRSNLDGSCSFDSKNMLDWETFAAI